MEKEPRIVVDVAQNLAEVIASRDIADKLKSIIIKTNSKLVDLDFKSVRVISRSAAHELLLIKENLAQAIEKKEVAFINTNKDIENILRVVTANRALPKADRMEPNIQKTDLKSLLKGVRT